MNNEELIKRIERLERWRDDRKKQQITFPLDQQSIEILNKYFLRIVDGYVYFGGAGTNAFPILVGKQDTNFVDLRPGLIQYTADPSTDVITIVNQQVYSAAGSGINQFANDATLVLFTTDTEPGGLSAGGLTTYYVVSAAANGFSFKLSLSSGGAAVNITDTGIGRQFLERI
jgi:hypothetical protein